MRAAELALGFALACQPACFGAEISGLWSVKGGRPEVALLAIQLEQDGDRLTVVKVRQSPRGRSLERREYWLPRDAEVATVQGSTEIHFGADDETWIIRSSGELILIRKGEPPLVLGPARQSIGHIGIRQD